MTTHPNVPSRASGTAHDQPSPASSRATSFAIDPGSAPERRWIGDNPAGAIELSDADLRRALKAAPICTKYASISTTWCDNPNAC